MQYEIKRKAGNADVIVTSVYPIGTQSRQAMGADIVDMTFSLADYVDIRIGDFVDVYGLRYYINLPVKVDKLSSRNYSYTVQFEAEWYDLAKVQYQFLNPQNQLLEPVFDLTGTADDFIDLLVQNANRHSAGWTIGVVDQTDYKTLPFSTQNCLQVLHTLANEFETEFWIENKTIHLQKREQSSGYTFEYGKGNGLYNISRQNKSNINIFTRLYVRGGSTNLPANYVANSLLLPNGDTYIQDDAKVALYGLIEASQVFENIFPMREGSVTAVVGGADNWKYFTDSSLDFDINDHKATGLDAKVAFNTGQLAGYTFTISDYNHATKQFTINKNGDETNLEIPSNTLRPAVGDKYVLIDITMPQIDVTNAESKLLGDAQKHYDKNSDPKFLMAYSATCDPLFIRQNNIAVTLGNTAILFDADMGINTELRIAKYTRDLQNANLYPSLEWSDTIGADEIVRQYQQQQKTLKMLASSGLLDPAQMRKALFLNRLSENNGYLMLGGDKIKAGYADDADKWDGKQFSDYLDQPLRTNDGVRFKSITSTSYVSGALGSGFKIDENGNAEFDNLTVRKQFNVFELIVNKIRATNGSLAVTDAATVSTVAANGANYNITFNEDLPFVTGDILRCQVFSGNSIKSYWLLVNNVAGATINVAVMSGNGASIAKGDTIVRMGSTSNANRQGLLYLTSSEAGSPYLDVLDGVTSTELSGKTKVRLGKLDGIVDAGFGALSGYGLFAQRAFIKGHIEVTGGNAQTIQGAQNQANAAQAAAIAAAANDAQAKANAAQAAAAAMVDAVKVGGRNLLLKSDFKDGLYGWNINGGTAVATVVDGRSCVLIESAAAGNGIYAFNRLSTLKTNAQYVVSFDIKGVSYQNLSLIIGFNAISSGNVVNVPNSTEWTRVSYITSIGNDANDAIIIYGNGGNQKFYITNLKIEEGNKATAWTPAVEDVDTSILAAKQAADTANSSYAALTASLKSMAYQDVVELSKLGSTVIENGMIKTTLLDASYIRANVVNAAYINTLNIDAAAIKSGTIDSSRINAAQIISNGGGATQAAVNAAQAAAIASAAADASSKVAAIKIGGRNMVKNSNFSNGLAGWGINGGGISFVADSGRYALRIQSTSYGHGVYSFNLLTLPLKPYTDYAISFDVKGEQYDSLTLAVGFNSAASNTVNVPNSTEWARVSYVTKTGNYSGNEALIIYGGGGNQTFLICNLKIEEGNKPTEWALAPEDVQNAVVNGQTIIQGGYINTQLLDANAIKANIVNAAYINSLEIVTKNLKTANSGKRVEIDSTENNVRILDAANNVLIEIDDDSAYEYTQILTNPPQAVKRFGAGIRVGAKNGESASLCKYGLTVQDSNGNIIHKINSRDNVSTNPLESFGIILDADKGMILRNMPNYYNNAPKKNIKLSFGYVDTDQGSYPVIQWEEQQS